MLGLFKEIEKQWSDQKLQLLSKISAIDEIKYKMRNPGCYKGLVKVLVLRASFLFPIQP